MKTVIDNETGELIEVEETKDLVAKDLENKLVLTEDTYQLFEDLRYAEEQVEMYKARVKEKIIETFKEHNVKSFSNDYISITYVPETMQKRVDNDRLKEDGLYDKYLKFVPVKEQIKIKLKGRND